ncbi:MAG: type I-B CRISPR-associated protein Cas5b [Nitrososphaeria archaeon]
MSSLDVLIFDVSSDYACFRVPYTITSIVSYPFPPRTTLSGLIAAILGLEKETYGDIFSEKNSKISLGIRAPIKKIILGLNLLDTKFGITMSEISRRRKNFRIQVPIEFLKNPVYRVYVWLNNDTLFKKLERNLSENSSFYTPCLGLASSLAKINFIGKFKAEYSNSENIPINSIVPKKYIKYVELQKDLAYQYVRGVPLYMDNDRTVVKFEDFIYNPNLQPILLKKAEYIGIKNGENIIPF